MPIRCDEYDKIEMACMYHYPVTVVCSDGVSLSGIAQDTKRNDLKEECIALSLHDDVMKLVVLTSLVSMTIDIDNPHFNIVVFSR